MTSIQIRSHLELLPAEAKDAGNGCSNTTSPADLWFSNGQILPHAFLSHALNKGPRTTCIADGSIGSSSSSRSSSISSNTSSRSNNSRNPASLRRSNGSTNGLHQNSTKRPSDSAQANDRSLSMDAYRARPLASPVKISQVKKNDYPGYPRSWNEVPVKKKADIGEFVACRRFFQSFVAAFRECRALEPSGQVDRMPGKIIVHA